MLELINFFQPLSVLILQSINSNKKKIDFFDLAENFKFELELILSYFATLFVGLLLCLVISRLTLKINMRQFKRENIYSRLSILSKHLSRSKLWPIKMIFLFLILFFWYTRLFLTNNIKTNKVVVDTSDLIKNSVDLMKTKKIVCFLNKESEMNLALRLPSSTTLSKLFYEKTYFKDNQVKEKLYLGKDRCLIDLDHKLVEFAKNDDILFVNSEADCKSSYFFKSKSHISIFIFSFLACLYLMLFSEFIKKIWLLNKGIHYYNVVLYYTLHNSFDEKWGQTM